MSVSVVVHEPEQLEGENAAVTPLGSPEAENVGLAVPVTVTVMELVAEPPRPRLSDDGLADRLMLDGTVPPP